MFSACFPELERLSSSSANSKRISFGFMGCMGFVCYFRAKGCEIQALHKLAWGKHVH